MRINFIRHGKTAGNLEQRYIGATDQPLCAEGIDELTANLTQYPSCDIVISSTMRRCIQTAEIIYPNKEPLLIDELRECDFGDFEGKNYIELSSDERYQAWIDSGGAMPFPNGESHTAFKKRCCDAFYEAVKKYDKAKAITFVIHGGGIMAVMEKYAEPKQSFYAYQVKNGCGFCTEFDGERLVIISRLAHN